MKLDTEVLNLLPAILNRSKVSRFTTATSRKSRELTFALVCQPDDVDKLEEFAPQFADSLRKQPWCKRVLAGSPMETPEGVHDLQAIALPLLLNLEPAAFDETFACLQPEKIQAAPASVA